MKLLTSFFLCLISICVFTPVEAYAELTKEDARHISQKARSLEKEGWKVFGGGSIEKGLNCISEMQSGGKYVIEYGDAFNMSTFELAFQYATRNAFAVICYTHHLGNSLSERPVDSIVEYIYFRSSMKFLPIPILTLFRKHNNGGYDCRIYYAISEEALRHSQKDLNDDIKLNIFIECSFEDIVKED